MRVINANRTYANTSPSKRTAKRAVLMALLVASSSTAAGQSPSKILSHSHFQESSSTPRLVREGARIMVTPQVGSVQANPYFSATAAPTFAPISPSDGNPQHANLNHDAALGQNSKAHVHDPRFVENAGIQRNPLFVPPRLPQASDQPLIHDLHSTEFPSAPFATAVDRFAQDTGNAFVRQRQPNAQTPSTAIESVSGQRMPMPMTFAAESAEPIQPVRTRSAGANVGNRQMSRIDVIDNAGSRVIPVADARDSQATIQETQPIFFTLSDDGELDAEEITSEAAIAAAIESLQNQTAAADQFSDLEPEDNTLQTGDESTDTEQPDSIDPAPHTDQQIPADSEKTVVPALEQVETPVKLAPVMRFAPQQSNPAEQRTNVVPFDQKATEKTKTPAVDELVVSKRTRLPIADPLNAADRSIVNDEPTIKIERFGVPATDADSTLEPLVQNAAPTFQLADLPEQSQPVHNVKGELGQTPADSSESEIEGLVPTPNQRVPVVNAGSADQTVAQAPISRPQHESVPTLAVAAPSDAPVALATVGPIVEKIGSDETPLIGSPLMIDPTRRSAEKSEVVHHKSISPLARMASSRSVMDKKPLPELPKSIVLEGAPSIPRDATLPEMPRDAVVLQLSRAQVRSMTIGGTLEEVVIDNTDICQAFASGANQIKLIGTGTGRTAMTIRANVVDGQPARVQSFIIEVNDAVNATGGKVTGHTDLLNDSIDKAFPSASVVVSQRGGELIVTGRCDDEETAKQIIRMVRKTCLIPVQDQLSVR